MKYLIAFALPFLLSCAQLHHVQIGDIESPPGVVLVPFDIKISEVGVSMQDATAIARSTSTNGNVGDLGALIAMTQLGPTTGEPVYDQHYADKVMNLIYEKCPSGRVTGLNSIREARKYPVISGEIVKITGYCMKDRKQMTAKEKEEI